MFCGGVCVGCSLCMHCGVLWRLGVCVLFCSVEAGCVCIVLFCGGWVCVYCFVLWRLGVCVLFCSVEVGRGVLCIALFYTVVEVGGWGWEGCAVDVCSVACVLIVGKLNISLCVCFLFIYQPVNVNVALAVLVLLLL